MNSLVNINGVEVSINDREFLADSRMLAPHLDVKHKSLVDTIRTYQNNFARFGKLPLRSAPIETVKGLQNQTYAELNEDQCYFLLTLVRNSERTVALKENLVHAFRACRTALANRDAARLEGKKVRRLETDSIAELVAYAKGQGSMNAEKYYVSITNLTNKLLNIEPGQRDALPPDTLKKINIVETVIDIAIRDALNAGLKYKDVYRVIRNRVNDLGPIVVNPKMLEVAA